MPAGEWVTFNSFIGAGLSRRDNGWLSTLHASSFVFVVRTPSVGSRGLNGCDTDGEGYL